MIFLYHFIIFYRGNTRKIMYDFSIAQRHRLIVEMYKGQQLFPFSDNLLNLSNSPKSVWT